MGVFRASLENNIHRLYQHVFRSPSYFELFYIGELAKTCTTPLKKNICIYVYVYIHCKNGVPTVSTCLA